MSVVRHDEATQLSNAILRKATLEPREIDVPSKSMYATVPTCVQRRPQMLRMVHQASVREGWCS